MNKITICGKENRSFDFFLLRTNKHQLRAFALKSLKENAYQFINVRIVCK